MGIQIHTSSNRRLNAPSLPGLIFKILYNRHVFSVTFTILFSLELRHDNGPEELKQDVLLLNNKYIAIQVQAVRILMNLRRLFYFAFIML